MLNNLLEKTITKSTNKKFQKKLKISDIEKFYLNSIKTSSMFGLEYERLSIDKNTFKSAEYSKVSKIIENFSKINSWELIFDNETIIGAKSYDGCSISLEPGNQIEISLKPMENISDIDVKLSKITRR